jgi:hypothetical protein
MSFTAMAAIMVYGVAPEEMGTAMMSRGLLRIGCVLALALCVVAQSLVGSSARAATAPPPPRAASITLNPDRALPDAVFTVAGQNFGNGSVTITWRDAVGHNQVLDYAPLTNGSFSKTVTVPANAAPDVYTVTALNQANGKEGSAIFTVTTPNTYATISPATGGPDARYTIRGGGFPSSDSLNVLMDGAVIATTRTARDGTFSLTFVFPATSAPPNGPHSLLIEDGGGLSATVQVTITGGSDPGSDCNWICQAFTTAVKGLAAAALAPVTALMLGVAALIDNATGSIWRDINPTLTYANGTVFDAWHAMMWLGYGLLGVFFLGWVIAYILGFSRDPLPQVFARLVVTALLMSGAFDLFTWSQQTMNLMLGALDNFTFASFFDQMNMLPPSAGGVLTFTLALIALSVMVIILTVQVYIRIAIMDITAIFSGPMFATFFRPATSTIGMFWAMTYLGQLVANIAQVITLEIGLKIMVAGMSGQAGLNKDINAIFFSTGMFMATIALPGILQRALGGAGLHHTPLTLMALAASTHRNAGGAAQAARASLGTGPVRAAAGAAAGPAGAAVAAATMMGRAASGGAALATGGRVGTMPGFAGGPAAAATAGRTAAGAATAVTSGAATASMSSGGAATAGGGGAATAGGGGAATAGGGGAATTPMGAGGASGAGSMTAGGASSSAGGASADSTGGTSILDATPDQNGTWSTTGTAPGDMEGRTATAGAAGGMPSSGGGAGGRQGVAATSSPSAQTGTAQMMGRYMSSSNITPRQVAANIPAMDAPSIAQGHWDNYRASMENPNVSAAQHFGGADLDEGQRHDRAAHFAHSLGFDPASDESAWVRHWMHRHVDNGTMTDENVTAVAAQAIEYGRSGATPAYQRPGNGVTPPTPATFRAAKDLRTNSAPDGSAGGGTAGESVG